MLTHQVLIDKLLHSSGHTGLIASPEDILCHVEGRVLSIRITQQTLRSLQEKETEIQIRQGVGEVGETLCGLRIHGISLFFLFVFANCLLCQLVMGLILEWDIRTLAVRRGWLERRSVVLATASS